MYSAAVEGLSPDQRAIFDEALAPRRRLRALPATSVERPALRSVPALSPERTSPERLAAIRQLGGDVTMNEGA